MFVRGELRPVIHQFCGRELSILAECNDKTVYECRWCGTRITRYTEAVSDRTKKDARNRGSR